MLWSAHSQPLCDENDMPWLAMSMAVVIGMVFAQQPVINSAVARILGSPIHASLYSVIITVCGMALLLPFSAGTFRPSVLATLPWWSVLGGLTGVAIVAGGAYLAPVLGAAFFFVCLVAGQLMGAAIADHIGAFGLPVRNLSVTRVAGLALVVVGALLVNRG